MRSLSSGLVTSAATNSPPSSSASASPASASRSTTTTVRPLGRQPPARGGADPAGPARDDGDPVLEAAARVAPSSTSRFSRSAMKTFLVSVNAASASGPSSRPSPERLKPPNGVEYRTDECEFTDRLPLSTPRATRSARPRSRVQIDPDRPYSLSLAMRDRRRPRRRTAARRRPGRTPPRATPGPPASGAAPPSAGTRTRARPAPRRGTRRPPAPSASSTYDRDPGPLRRADQRTHLGVLGSPGSDHARPATAGSSSSRNRS